MQPFVMNTFSTDNGDVTESKKIGGDSGSGGDVTAKAVMEAIVDMNSTQAETTREALGAEDAAGVVALIQGELSGYAPAPITTTVTGSTPTIALCEDNHIYECGDVTSLTVTAIDNPGEFSITFTSGSTATVLTVPNTMIMPDGFSVEASTRYEINVKDGYALVAGWAVSA